MTTLDHDTADTPRHDPYDADRPLLMRCACGESHAARAACRPDAERETHQFIEASLIKAIFPQDHVRRAFIRAVGKRTAMAAIRVSCRSARCRRWRRSGARPRRRS